MDMTTGSGSLPPENEGCKFTSAKRMFSQSPTSVPLKPIDIDPPENIHFEQVNWKKRMSHVDFKR